MTQNSKTRRLLDRDIDDIRKRNGRLTIGWQIARILCFALFAVMFAGVFLFNMKLLYGALIGMVMSAAVARIIRRKQRNCLRQLQQNGDSQGRVDL